MQRHRWMLLAKDNLPDDWAALVAASHADGVPAASGDKFHK
jgi:hypothetical protein